MKKAFSFLLLIFFAQAALAQHFGNGFHNGWADQNSIVIWTRLTQNKEMNWAGSKFLPLSNKQHAQLKSVKDKKQIDEAQFPKGLTLADMEGACLGTSGEVRLSYFPKQKPQQKVVLPWTKVDENKNFTKQWKLNNLQANTHYEVKLEARKNGKSPISDVISGVFQTPANETIPEEIKFAVVSCHDFIRRDDSLGGHKIYRAMLNQKPNFYVHTGDIEYYDKPNPYALTEELMRFKWDRLFALPLQRKFWMQTTSYFQKDDHDVLSDDAYPGMTYGQVSFERGVEIFDKEQFPSNEPRYKTVRWGKDLQVWILEGRNFRSNNNAPDGESKTILGKEQKDWLIETMKASSATFKVIITPTPILGPDRVNKNDNLANIGFKHEGDEIRDFINQQENVYICNGDRHWQYVTHHENTNLWEFGCGAGSDSHAEGFKEQDRQPEQRFLRIKGGYLMGQVSRQNDVPTIQFQHFDVDGKMVNKEEFTLKK